MGQILPKYLVGKTRIARQRDEEKDLMTQQFTWTVFTSWHVFFRLSDFPQEVGKRPRRRLRRILSFLYVQQTTNVSQRISQNTRQHDH